MPQFNLKALLYSTTLICIGLGLLSALIFHTETISSWPAILKGLYLFSIAPIICAGLLLPFGWAWTGFGFGLLLGSLFLEYIFSTKYNFALIPWLLVASGQLIGVIMIFVGLRRKK